ncbi:hypothetical protein V2J09_023250 [Rumex salicifolius]
MKHKISEGGSIFGSPSPSPLVRPHSIPENGRDAGKVQVPEDYPLGCEIEADGGREREDGVSLGKHLDGEVNAYPSEVHELESDDDGEESEKDDEEEEEEEEEEEVLEADMEGEIVLADASEGGKAGKLAEGRGWPESSNTWEPLEHLQLCPDIVEAYEQSLQSGKKTRKRKRKYTQPKKKLQYSYASSGSKEVKKSRVGRKPSENEPLHEPSYNLGRKETKGDEYSSDKDNDTRKITIQLQEAAKGDGSSVNSSSKGDSTEPSQGDRRTGAKRRKSGSVQRFKPDSSISDPSHAANSIPVNGSYDSAEQLMTGNIDLYPKMKFDLSRDSSIIIRILKPIGYSTSKSNEVEDVSVTFVAIRSDGKEVVVDNKFLKANYPHVLIDFYEQHLRYSPAT